MAEPVKTLILITFLSLVTQLAILRKLTLISRNPDLSNEDAQVNATLDQIHQAKKRLPKNRKEVN